MLLILSLAIRHAARPHGQLTRTHTLTHAGGGRCLILLVENDSHFSQTLACNISFHKGQRGAWHGTMWVMRKAPWKFKRSKPHLSLSTWLLGIPECPNSDADSEADFDCDLAASAWLSQHARVRRNVDRSSSSSGSSATSAKMTVIIPRVTG